MVSLMFKQQQNYYLSFIFPKDLSPFTKEVCHKRWFNLQIYKRNKNFANREVLFIFAANKRNYENLESYLSNLLVKEDFMRNYIIDTQVYNFQKINKSCSKSGGVLKSMLI